MENNGETNQNKRKVVGIKKVFNKNFLLRCKAIAAISVVLLTTGCGDKDIQKSYDNDPYQQQKHEHQANGKENWVERVVRETQEATEKRAIERKQRIYNEEVIEEIREMYRNTDSPDLPGYGFMYESIDLLSDIKDWDLYSPIYVSVKLKEHYGGGYLIHKISFVDYDDTFVVEEVENINFEHEFKQLNNIDNNSTFKNSTVQDEVLDEKVVEYFGLEELAMNYEEARSNADVENANIFLAELTKRVLAAKTFELKDYNLGEIANFSVEDFTLATYHRDVEKVKLIVEKKDGTQEEIELSGELWAEEDREFYYGDDRASRLEKIIFENYKLAKDGKLTFEELDEAYKGLLKFTYCKGKIIDDIENNIYFEVDPIFNYCKNYRGILEEIIRRKEIYSYH